MKKLAYLLLGVSVIVLSLWAFIPVQPVRAILSAAYTPIPRLQYTTFLHLINTVKDATLVSWNPKVNELAIANADNANIAIVNSDTVTLQNTLTMPPDSVDSDGVGRGKLEWSPNGEFLAAAFGSTGSYPHIIVIWQPSARPSASPLILDNTEIVYSISWSADSSKLAVAKRSQVVIYDAHSGKQIDKLQGNSDGIDMIAWSPDDKNIASVSAYGKVQVWDAQTYRLRVNLSKPEWFLEPAEVIVWSPNGEELIGADCNVSLGGCEFWEWNIATGKVQAPFKDDKDATGQANEGRPLALIWQPNGLLLFTVSDASSIWDVTTGKMVAAFGSIRSASWSPNGRKLATVNEDGSITIGEIN